MVMLFWKIIGSRKSRWIKAIILGGLAFFLLFASTYQFFFHNFMVWEIAGIKNIPAKILGVLLAMMAWDVKQTG